mmetsp:Transcript_87746/g.174164  ORF Transcript_87746/g.174164 Transcript_87746/m.174164 type:complete len:212 (+) Transcript_87746:2066-2701(+)
MQRWKPCWGKWIVHELSTFMHPNSVIPDVRRSSGRLGEGSRSSMETRTLSETCCVSREACRRCSRRCTSMQQILRQRVSLKSWTRCRRPSGLSRAMKIAKGRRVRLLAVMQSVREPQPMQQQRARNSLQASSRQKGLLESAAAMSSSLVSRVSDITRMPVLQSLRCAQRRLPGASVRAQQLFRRRQRRTLRRSNSTWIWMMMTMMMTTRRP